MTEQKQETLDDCQPSAEQESSMYATSAANCDGLPLAFAMRSKKEQEIDAGRVWNTSVLAEKDQILYNTPAECGGVDPVTPQVRKLYEQYVETQNSLGCFVDRENSPAYKACRKALDWILLRAEYSAEMFEFDILKSPRENAFIIHHETLAKPHIFITTALIKKLTDELGSIREGHLKFIFGHEVAHFALGHYEAHKPQFKRKGNDPIEIRARSLASYIDIAKDHLFSLAFTRDQENRADELSLRWCATGTREDPPTNPLEGVAVLECFGKLAEAYTEKQNADAPKSGKKRFSLLGWMGMNLTSTHPGARGRAARAKGVVRQIEVEQSGEYSSASMRRRWTASDKIPSISRSKDIELTATQTMLKVLNSFVTVNNDKLMIDSQALTDYISDRIKSFKVEQFDRAMEEIRHLNLLLPALFSISEDIVPRKPYDHLSSVREDKVGKGLIAEGLTAAKAIVLTSLIEELSKTSENLRKAKLEILELHDNSSNQIEVLRTNLVAYLSGPIEYVSDVRQDLFRREILPALQESPQDSVSLLCALGKQYFDFSTFKTDWVKILCQEADQGVVDRGQCFAKILEQQYIDLRVDLIEQALVNGLLDGVIEETELISVIEQIEQNICDTSEWHSRDIGRILGSNVALWLEEHFEIEDDQKRWITDSKLSTLILSFADRDRGAEADLYDAVLLELASTYLASEVGTFEERKEWLLKTFKPSQLRDLLLCELLECETKLFRYDLEDQKMYAAAKRVGRISDDKKYKDIRNGFRKSLKFASKEVVFLSEVEATLFEERAQELQGLFEGLWFKIGLKTTDEQYKFREFNDGKELAGSRSRFVDIPLHSPMLSNFAQKVGYRLRGPNTRSANTLRYYLDNFLSVRMTEEVTRDNASNDIRRKLYDDLARDPATILVAMERTRELHYMSFRRIYEDQETGACDLTLAPDQATPFFSAWKFFESRRAISDINLFDRAALLNKALEGPPVDDMAMLQALPEGEFRDFLILRDLAAQIEIDGLERTLEGIKERKEIWSKVDSWSLAALDSEERGVVKIRNTINDTDFIVNPYGIDGNKNKLNLQELKKYLSLLSKTDQNSLNREKIDISTTLIERAYRLELLDKVYKDFLLFLRLRSGDFSSRLELGGQEMKVLNLPDIATEVARLALKIDQSYPDNRTRFNSLTAEEKLDEIEGLFVYPSVERDSYLINILEEYKTELNGSNTDLYYSPLARRTYHLLCSTYYQADIGEQIYKATLECTPLIAKDFDAHLDLILSTHPQGSVRRDKRLHMFFDGGSHVAALVHTWEQRDKIIKLLEDQNSTTADSQRLFRQGGVQIIEAAINELDISPRERVDTILWMAGFREKSHLVRCYEALERTNGAELKNELDRLTDDEKKNLIRAILIGPQGVLMTDDIEAKKQFLDTLFFSVFQEGADQKEIPVRQFKAIYDTMLHYIEPDRAANFLGDFLVQELQGQEFNQKVKVFFLSFGFVGIKTAQYLVSSTTLIPEDTRKALMDLTSRVEGPDKRFVFELAEKTYGKTEARKIIRGIGDRVGGGSLMSFYDVELCDGRVGVVGVLRPDIVHALPEDIALVHRLIETMQEVPEIYSGKIVSMDLMDNLVWMSLVETELGRTARLQKKMKDQIEEIYHQIPVHIPAIWSDIDIENQNGTLESIALNQGSFIFMEKAKGVTLDLFWEKCEQEGAIGVEKLKKVLNRVVDKFLDQVTKYGLVHCDLHPGNILVDENGQVEITILDIGLSTELKEEITTILHRYLRIAVGKTDFSNGSSSMERVFKKMFGIGEIQEDKAKLWVKESIDLFENVLDQDWGTELKGSAVDTIYRIMSDRETSVQTKLAQVMDLSRELGLFFPREFYYVLRAVSVMDYAWSHVDWKKQAMRFRGIGESVVSSRLQPELNVDTIVDKVALVAKRARVNIDIATIRTAIEEANKIDELDEWIGTLRKALVSAIPTSDSDGHELFKILMNDNEFRADLGLSDFADKMQDFFELQRSKREKSVGKELGFLSAAPLAAGEAKRNAYLNRFGSLEQVWRTNAYPGTPVRVLNDKGKVVGGYAVLPHASLRSMPDELKLGRFESLKKFQSLVKVASPLLGGLKSELDIFSLLSKTARDHHNISSQEEEYSFLRSHLLNEDQKLLEHVEASEHLSEEEKQRIKFIVYTNKVGTVDGDPLVTPWDLYSRFITQIQDRDLYDTVITLRKLEEQRPGQVELLIDGRWLTLDECRLQKGETEQQYLKAMREFRANRQLSQHHDL